VADRPVWARSDNYRPLPKNWNRLRRRVLRRSVLCHVCRLPGAVEVDHVIPRWRGGDDSEANLAGICHPCHVKKSERENVEAVKAAAAVRRSLSRRPVERHPGRAV